MRDEFDDYARKYFGKLNEASLAVVLREMHEQTFAAGYTAGYTKALPVGTVIGKDIGMELGRDAERKRASGIAEKTMGAEKHDYKTASHIRNLIRTPQ